MFRNLKTFIVYLAYLGMVLEIASRLIFKIDAPFNLNRTNHEVAWRRAWMRRHDARTEIYYPFDVYNPARGWAVKPNLSSMGVFNHKRLSTNSRGIRGPEYSYDRPAGKKRILVLGDSNTFGDEVSDTETYPYYLQTFLPRTEVINMGVHGYGHDQMLIYLKEEGLKYRPEIVILGFADYDIGRNVLAFRDYAKPKYELVAGRLKLENYPVPPPESELHREPFRSKLLELMELLHGKISSWYYHRAAAGGSSPGDIQAERITAAILDDMKDAVGRTGAKLILVHLPVWSYSSSEKNSFLERYCKSRAVPCLDLTTMRRHLVFQAGYHWNADGHRAIAEGIRDYLLGRGPNPN